MTSTPADDPAGRLRRAGHESDPDYQDKDVQAPADLEREGGYEDKDVPSAAPEFDRQGDYTDKDVSDDDTDTPPGSYVASDIPP